MGYIIGVIVLILLIPLLIMLLTRRGRGPGGIGTSGHGVTHEQPSSDQPTPPGPGSKRIPPG